MNNIFSRLTRIVGTMKFRRVLCIFALLALLAFAFQVGEFVGFRKAEFAYRFGENYHRNFAGPRRGFFGDFKGEGFMNSHGTFGQVLKIDNELLLLKSSDGEKMVHVGTTTELRRFHDRILLSEIHVGEGVVVIGSPTEDGMIEAKFIRIMPSTVFSDERTSTSSQSAPANTTQQ